MYLLMIWRDNYGILIRGGFFFKPTDELSHIAAPCEVVNPGNWGHGVAVCNFWIW